MSCCCCCSGDSEDNHDCCCCLSTDACVYCCMSQSDKFWHDPQWFCLIFSREKCVRIAHCYCCGGASADVDVLFKIAELSTKERYKLSDAVGVDRDDHDGAICLQIIDNIASTIDAIIGPYTGGLSPCMSIAHPLCLQLAIAKKLEDVLKDHLHYENDEDYQKMMHAIAADDSRVLHHFSQMYYEHVMGFRRTFDEAYFSNDTDYTIEQINSIFTAMKKLKYETISDPLFVEKVIRILNIGSADYEIETNCCYSLCASYNPCVKYCYGGSRKMMRDLIIYCNEEIVPVADVIYVMENFEPKFGEDGKTIVDKGLWHAYLGEFIHVAVTMGLEKEFKTTLKNSPYLDFFTRVGLEDLYEYEVGENVGVEEKKEGFVVKKNPIAQMEIQR